MTQGRITSAIESAQSERSELVRASPSGERQAYQRAPV
jgi:hypothetical protein